MPAFSSPIPVVLTIAGFDPTSGAGLSADLKSLAANNCYGVACISAITVQSTTATRRYQAVAADLLEEQLECLLSDIAPRAVKIGMLGSAANIEVVARSIEKFSLKSVVLDPVLQSTSGLPLLDAKGIKALQQRLCPLVTVITPNLAEAESLTGIEVSTLAQMQAAADALRGFGTPNVVVTGGHLDKPIDVYFDGVTTLNYSGDRIRTPHDHGTGCSFSSALAANLAHGRKMSDAIVQAKAYVTAALRQAYPIGKGRGPLNHLFRLQEPMRSKNVDPAPQQHAPHGNG
ncbi:MAG: bifunctional hydroxymethylpyrimidine kinase/phosphomethylpyrimidine kinase [Terriglobales bacterium]